MFEGVFAILAAIIMRSSFAAVMATLVVGIIITIATLIYAHKIYKEEIAADR